MGEIKQQQQERSTIKPTATGNKKVEENQNDISFCMHTLIHTVS